MPGTPDVPDAAAAPQEATARLREQNAELPAENAEPRAQLTGQAGKTARLERLISPNSRTSSMPSSADAPSARRMLAVDGCMSNSSNPACCFCAIWVPRPAEGAAVAMFGHWLGHDHLPMGERACFISDQRLNRLAAENI